MKHGIANAPDSEFKYWVLPDKPMSAMQTGNTLTGGWQDWDRAATNANAEKFRDLLGRSCKGKWMETNHRYFFELEEDYKMFLIMCSLTT